MKGKLSLSRSQNLTINKTSKSPPPRDAAWCLQPWEQLTPKTVRQYHDEMMKIASRSHSFRPHPARAGGGRQQASFAGFLTVLPHRQGRRRAAAAERPGNAREVARFCGVKGSPIRA